MSDDQLSFSLPVTERFAWKFRNIVLNGDDIGSYLRQKKSKLFSNVLPEQGQTSLLSLLPDPFSVKDIEKASKRILKAFDNQEKITIYGDYDVDGTTSCAMLKCFFDDIGFPVEIYIPDRLQEGYGLSSVGVTKLAQTGTKLIITVDNGIAALEGCQTALNCGVDVIITDHHDIPPVLPQAFAILNPKQTDCLFPYKMLAGVGVAFYLMIAIRALLRKENISKQINLRNYLDFVAIGTIADMAPLDGVNHILCRTGLDVLFEHIQNQRRPGLASLLKVSGWNESNGCISASDIGFKLGPRLNAAGRLGNALRSVDVLSTNRFEDGFEIAQFLHSENSDRQFLEKQHVQEALAMVAQQHDALPHALVLHKENWHPGVIGLVASRVLEKHYRPTLILTTLDGKIKGSGRSTHGFDLFSALNAVRDEFISFGGHFHAVGLTLDPQKLDWLKSYLEQTCANRISAEDRIPVLQIDGALSCQTLTVDFLKQLAALEPYGIENPRPKWLIGPAIVRHIKRIGKDLSQGHARILLLENGREFWVTAFGMADIFEKLLESGMDVQLVIDAKLHVWNGRLTVEMNVIDFAPVLKITNATFLEKNLG